MSTSTSSTSTSASGRPKRPPVLVAAGFIAAFGATIATVVLTGLFVRAPGSADTPAAGPSTEAEAPRSRSVAPQDTADAEEDAERESAPQPD